MRRGATEEVVQSPVRKAPVQMVVTPPGGSSLVTAVFTPVRNTSLTGTLLQAPSPQMTAQVMQAAVDTAAGFASPPDKFMSTHALFKLVKLANANNSHKLIDRVRADRSLLRSRSAGMQGRDGLTLLHYAAHVGNVVAVEALLEAAGDEAKDLVWLVDIQVCVYDAV
jgi:hypothetical protein